MFISSTKGPAQSNNPVECIFRAKNAMGRRRIMTEQDLFYDAILDGLEPNVDRPDQLLLKRVESNIHVGRLPFSDGR